MAMLGNNSKSKEGHSVGIGTPIYMAPEQSKGKGKYNFKADMYSLGIIFFEMWNSLKTFIEKDRAIGLLRLGKIPEEYVKNMPNNAIKII